MAKVEEIQQKLEQPFTPREIIWSVGTPVPGKHMYYVNPSIVPGAIRARLNEVLTIGGWTEDYSLLPTGQAHCQLGIWFGGERVYRVGIGEPIGDNKTYDRSYVTAFRFAAARFGVGWYLEKIRPQLSALCEIIDGKAVIKEPPKLPLFATHPDWIACGTEMGKRLIGLLDTVAAKSKQPSGEIRTRLLAKHGIPSNVSNYEIPKAVVRECFVALDDWIAELSKSSE